MEMSLGMMGGKQELEVGFDFQLVPAWAQTNIPWCDTSLSGTGLLSSCT